MKISLEKISQVKTVARSDTDRNKCSRYVENQQLRQANGLTYLEILLICGRINTEVEHRCNMANDFIGQHTD